ncbi:MAG: hypothetical protein M3Z46_02895 [Actinomycetota bacterium]|nr:hypothetical protein [Actinomycetota bacterium]
MPGVCDSCGDEVDDLVAVHRIYVMPATDGEVSAQRSSEIEHWCFPCRTHYPHELIVAK